MQAEQKLWSWIDRYRGNISSYNLWILFMQLAAWKKLSHEGKLEEDLTFDSFYHSNVSLERLQEIFYNLSQEWPGFSTHYYGTDLVNFTSNDIFISLLHETIDIDSFDYHQLIEGWRHYFRGEFITPKELCHLFVELVKTTDEVGTIYNPFAHQYDLAYSLSKITGCKVHTEDSLNSPTPDLLNYLYDIQLQPAFSNPLVSPSFKETEHLLKKFDIVVSIPPLGLRGKEIIDDRFNRFYFSKQESEVAIIEHILAQTQNKAFVLVPNRLLSRGVGREKQLRNYLIEQELVEAVIALPQNILYSTTIATNILVLNPLQRQDQVLFIDATSCFEQNTKSRKNTLTNIDQIVDNFRTKKEVPSFTHKVSTELIKSKDHSLSINEFILTKEEQEAETLLSQVKTQPLSGIASLIRPQNLPDTKNTEGQFYYEIVTSDLPSAGFIGPPTKKKIVEAKNINRASKCIVKPYDVLLSIKGSTGKVGIIGEHVEPDWIAGQVFIIIRFQETLSHDVKHTAISLYMFLKSEIGQTFFQRLSEGSFIPSIQAKSIQNFQVPLLTNEQKERAVEKFYQEIDLYKEIEGIKTKIAQIHASFLE